MTPPRLLRRVRQTDLRPCVFLRFYREDASWQQSAEIAKLPQAPQELK